MAENQENKVALATPTLKVAETGLDKLSLNSPRSPLGQLNNGGESTPKRILQRKILSANKLLGAGPAAGSGSELERSKSVGSAKENMVKSLVFFPEEDEGENQELKSTGLQKLLMKPILHTGFSPIREEREESSPSGTPTVSLTGVGFKRPTPPASMDRREIKRARSIYPNSFAERIEQQTGEAKVFEGRPKLQRAQSESAICIKSAVDRINSDPNLVGDGSKVYLLPLVGQGKHHDLKEISPECLVSLMEGKFGEQVKSFQIIDCRYPYEFDGGHISGAINLHTKRQVYERFLGSKEPCSSMSEGKRHIVVFHCEFSSQRGPDMCRYLRDCDRKMNEYPFLHYPELYVLFGGYKAFFEEYKSYCIPQEYLPMVDERYVEQCRRFKSLSKTDIISTKKTKSFNSKTEGNTGGSKQFGRSGSMKKLCLDNL